MDVVKVIIPYSCGLIYDSLWMKPEVREWLESNVGIGVLTGTIEIMRHPHYFWAFQHSNTGIIFYFRNVTDAVLFKLTWGGNI